VTEATGSGKFAHQWIYALREEVESRQLFVDFAAMNPHGRELVMALGAKPTYEFFIERVPVKEIDALMRWKTMKDAGWEVDALTYDDGGQVTELVGLGCRYAPAVARCA
jgi:hypothetical protein